MIAAPIDGPLVEFFQMVPNPRPPARADRAVGGVIPARALRYCEAITSASAFGWYVFLPISFKVVWDGHDMLWTYDGVQEWLPLTRDAVQYPHFSEQFNEIAPPSVRGFSPPFLTSSIPAGGLQVWTGSWRGESFPERVVSDVRRNHRDGSLVRPLIQQRADHQN